VTGPQVFALCSGLLAVVMGVGIAVFAKQYADVLVWIQRLLKWPAPLSHWALAIFSRLFGVGFTVIGVVMFFAALTDTLT
jgi:hypothetical protein